MTCKLCGFKMESFRDDLSKREAALSGLCQTCQDSYFGGATETQMVAKIAEEKNASNQSGGSFDANVVDAVEVPQWIQDSQVELGAEQTRTRR